MPQQIVRRATDVIVVIILVTVATCYKHSIISRTELLVIAISANTSDLLSLLLN